MNTTTYETFNMEIYVGAQGWVEIFDTLCAAGGVKRVGPDAVLLSFTSKGGSHYSHVLNTVQIDLGQVTKANIASVMAHELGHVLTQYLERAKSRSLGGTFLSLYYKDAGYTAFVENLADCVGLSLMKKCGFDTSSRQWFHTDTDTEKWIVIKHKQEGKPLRTAAERAELHRRAKELIDKCKDL